MSQNFQAGDFLIFQIEAAYGLLRLLSIEQIEDEMVWHLAAYEEMFLDIEMADAALKDSDSLKVSMEHAALTNRAFEATQTARMSNKALSEDDLAGYQKWKDDPDRLISDRTVRLLLGLR